MTDLDRLATEQPNPKSERLDQMTALEIVTLMNEEDATIAGVIQKALPNIAQAVERIVEQFQRGGRLIYIGAGTSGRLGVLDASECPPTFGTDPEMLVAVLAGGALAMTAAIEGAEDDIDAGSDDLINLQVSERDAVVGITASGRTPYVKQALIHARRLGAVTIAIANNRGAEVSRLVDIAIELPTGPEVLTGSTRLKAGTAQKMVLNMLSTASMVLLGKTYKNLMIDLRPLNDKLIERARRMLMMLTGVSYAEAAQALSTADRQVKVALVMLLTGMTADEARARLRDTGGFVRPIIEK
ncbi:MAG: N-acetylmuramic acid 6-phosphate etherase [Candidatus Carbobacillus altaicus]|uniref:N-acetylmuramic acid 6-phosphate etherase n=1 Tax=Candidatus Carbonibacillus altaicus TaxID=2163959 RepID=A0A2R6Y1U0_9BACL|nr:MAG: N-acetylmuramic acid 6-phosphate etherase [Candidatus Carbobacillus altaicus]